MDPAIWQLLRDEGEAPGREVEAIIRLRHVLDLVPNVRMIARFGHVATCRVPAEAVRAVRLHPAVVSLKAARTLGPDLGRDGARGQFAIHRNDERRPAGSGLTGAGVVVGILDWGLDFDHSHFRHEDGTTRVLALWDQRDNTNNPPYPYGYGRVHCRQQINDALLTPHPYETLGYHPGDADRGGGSHGTHVTDIAAGSGRANGPSGIAPEAWLVFVHLADRGTGGLATLGDSVRLLEALAFVRQVAHQAGPLPFVVNVSVGRHGGPHDGRTLVELAFDELLSAAPGRCIVQSAGNYYRAQIHTTGVIAPSSTRTLTFRTHPDDTTPNELEIWYRGLDELAVQLTPPGSRAGPWVYLGEQSPVIAGVSTVGRLYHRASDPNNHDHHIDIFLSPSAPAGTWRVSLRAEQVVDGRFHAWLERDDRCPRCQARFTPAISVATGTIGTIANGRLPLVVGAVSAHDSAAPVARFSSAGPTRDNRIKPDLVAPGVNILAARSAPLGCAVSPGLLVRKSGTSMAAPHVTGAVALCLQATGRQLWARDIRQLVLDTARPMSISKTRTGAGQLDIQRLITSALRHHLTVSSRPEESTMQTESTPLPASPSRTFRELLYRPHGDLARWVERHFEVLARPFETITRAGRGDLLLKVSLGRPGPGTCTILENRYSAPNRLGPGQLLLRPRTDQGSAMSHLGAPTAEEQTAPPDHVLRARRLWRALFISSPSLWMVTIEDLSRAPSPIIQASDFTAWTNSPNAVYVSDLGAAADDAIWEAVLYHESLHVRQFRAAGGKPPSNYATMMRHECEAYTESARWVAARRRADPNDITSQMRATATKLRNMISTTERATTDPNRRDRQYRKFLLAEKLLPPHKHIRELYTRPPRRRTDAEATAADGQGREDNANDAAALMLPPTAETLEVRPPGPGERSAFDRRQELIDRLNFQSPAIQYQLNGRVIRYEIKDEAGLTNFDREMRRLIDFAGVIPMRLIDRTGFIGGSPLAFDSFQEAYVDLDDLLASSDLAFQLVLIHFLTERSQVSDYARRIGTNLAGLYPRAHRAGRKAEARHLRSVIGDDTIEYVFDEPRPGGAYIIGFRSRAERYWIFRVNSNQMQTGVRGSTVFVQMPDRRRVTVAELQALRAGANQTSAPETQDGLPGEQASASDHDEVSSRLAEQVKLPISSTTQPVKATKLPSRAGTQAPQAWETLAPIASRSAATCAGGLKNLGTILFVHDAETEIDLRDYGDKTNADSWMLVHTVSDLIGGLRAYVGNCGYVTGIHIEAHGGWSNHGGFRMGNDTNGDGHIQRNEATDMVSSAAQAATFGKIIKEALGTGGTSFISVAACSSAGPNGAFIKALHAATGTINIGSVGSCRSGGNWFSGAWWEAEKGRTQVNTDGTLRVDTTDEGTGIWRPF